MIIEGWEYYNHAAITTCAPHEIPNTDPVNDGSIWKIEGGRPMFARWTMDWDYGEKTEWWYVIKDRPFKMEDVKSKIRTKIRKGLKNFNCREIKPQEFAESICEVMTAALKSYRFSKDIEVDNAVLSEEIRHWADNIRVWGAFDVDGKLCSYTTVANKGNYYKMVGHKSVPQCENKQVNAAVLYKMLEDLNDEISCGRYICNGEKTVNHDTNFNDYLEEYFCFRKSYCTLHIKYKGLWGAAVKAAYPFRAFLRKFDNRRIPHLINSVMIMEEISRKSYR